MKDSTQSRSGPAWLSLLPPARWLAEYRAAWLASDVVAGVMLAAYAIPVSLAYAGLAGLPPQVGVYGHLLGGLGYALLGSSRQLAIGPTSAISLMIAGTVGEMAGGDTSYYAQIASLTGFVVALLCLIAWLLRLSGLVTLISDSILVGFKAGAALIIAMTQLPSLLGVPSGSQRKAPRRGRGFKVDRVRHLKAPVSPSPPMPQLLHRFQSRGRTSFAKTRDPPNRRKDGARGNPHGKSSGRRVLGKVS